MYILHCSRIWASVRSVSSFLPVAKVIPLLSSHVRTAPASASVTVRIAANSADWLSRSLNTPVAFSKASSMMALYIPMQPSSKTPMIALRLFSALARPTPSFRSASGSFATSSAWTWLRSWSILPSRIHCFNPLTKNGSSKSLLQMVENLTPAFSRLPFRFSIPTSPGHCPDQFATVRIGPR